MATLAIVRAGILTTVQDLGRPGWGAFGVPVSGAMDRFAARAANQMVGNPPRAPVVELTGPGAALALDEARLIAVGGGDLGAIISDATGEARPLPPWQSTRLSVGETLRFTARRSGARALLAIAGGLEIGTVFGSAGTDVANGLGGWHGRPLRSGDRLPLATARPASQGAAPSAALLTAIYGDPVLLRFLPTPNGSPALTAWLAEAPFIVTPQSNRVGFRLRAGRGGPPANGAAGERVSEPIAPGTLQLPPDGQPILLMADRQTIGGYPVAGHVITADLSRAAQLWPGDHLRFRAVDPADAQRLLRELAR